MRKLLTLGIIFLLLTPTFSTFIPALKAEVQNDGRSLEEIQLELEWQKTWGGKSADFGFVIAADGHHLFIGGITSSFGAGGRDSLILKVDKDGNVIWPRTWGADGDDFLEDITVVRDSYI